jgi:hypothetical protein
LKNENGGAHVTWVRAFPDPYFPFVLFLPSCSLSLHLSSSRLLSFIWVQFILLSSWVTAHLVAVRLPSIQCAILYSGICGNHYDEMQMQNARQSSVSFKMRRNLYEQSTRISRQEKKSEKGLISSSKATPLLGSLEDEAVLGLDLERHTKLNKLDKDV